MQAKSNYVLNIIFENKIYHLFTAECKRIAVLYRRFFWDFSQ